MTPQTQLFPLMLAAFLAAATGLSWTFLPDNGGTVPATLGILCGCVVLANVAAVLVEQAARKSIE